MCHARSSFAAQAPRGRRVRVAGLALGLALGVAPAAIRAQHTPGGESTAGSSRLAVEAQLANGDALDERARAEETGSEAATSRPRATARARALWRRAIAHHARVLRAYGRASPLDQRIRMNTALGRAYWNAGARAQALLYFRAADAAWGPALDPAQLPAGPSPGEAHIRADIADPELADGAVVRARAAVAEARFYQAEVVYARFLARRVPIFPGPSTQVAFGAWTRATLAPFVARQRDELEQVATPLYLNIMSLHAVEWELAAAERLAEMYFTFGGHLVVADTPPAVARDPAVREAYAEVRNDMAQRYFDVARTSFDACIGRAARQRVDDAWSRLCAQRRAELDDGHAGAGAGP
jgi:hypothetical protein